MYINDTTLAKAEQAGIALRDAEDAVALAMEKVSQCFCLAHQLGRELNADAALTKDICEDILSAQDHLSSSQVLLYGVHVNASASLPDPVVRSGGGGNKLGDGEG